MKFFNKSKKKKLTAPFLFVIDGSDGMCGEKAERLNRVFPKIIDVIANKLDDAVGVFSVLRVSEKAEWINKNSVAAKEKKLTEIIASGEYNLAPAIECVDRWLSEEFQKIKKTEHVFPVIVFITASAPKENYAPALEKLKKNPIFEPSLKIAIMLDNVAFDSMKAMCNLELIIHTNQPEDIPNILSDTMRRASVSVSACLPSIHDERFETGTSCHFEEFDLKKIEAIFAEDRDLFELSLLLKDESKDSTIIPDFKDFDSLFDDDIFDVSEKSTDTPESDSSTTLGACPICGSTTADGEICIVCDSRVTPKSTTPISVSQVQFSAVAPKQFIKGEYTMIDVTVYEETYRHIVDKIIENADTPAKEAVASPRDIKENTRVRICLSSPDVDIPDCDEEQIWRGKYLTYSFPVEIPHTYAKKNILFIASVYFNGVIATKLKFIASCTTERDQKLSLTREDVLTAFISYASQDRSRVATIIQGMKKARPDMDVFFDVESLRSGENWETRVYSEIEKRDVLFLCWSEFAKNSEWVDKEWRYALSYKGIDAIEPIPLVPPAKCPPPEELGSKHFNDTALLYS